MKPMNFCLFALMAFIGALDAAAGERKAADIACQPTAQKFVYDCMITLKGKKSGAPIAGAQFMVGADMPSMPGVHHMMPVSAKPHKMPGMYLARIHLEMFGEWALMLDFTKPDRDRVVKKLHFTGKMDHAEDKNHSSMAHVGHGQMKKKSE